MVEQETPHRAHEKKKKKHYFSGSKVRLLREVTELCFTYTERRPKFAAKAQVQLELKLTTVVPVKKKGFYKC